MDELFVFEPAPFPVRAHSRAHTPHGKSEPQKAKRGVHRDPRRSRLHNARRACGDQVGIELVEAPRRIEIKPRPEKQQRGIDRTPHRRGQLRAAHALRLQRPRREVGKHFHRSAVVLPAEERTMPKASQAGHTQLFHTPRDRSVPASYPGHPSSSAYNSGSACRRCAQSGKRYSRRPRAPTRAGGAAQASAENAHCRTADTRSI